MIKKILFSGLIMLSLTSFGFVFASETEGTVGTQLDTGISGTLRMAPVFSVEAGTYHANQSVALSATDSTSICYTTNGDAPTCNGATVCGTGTKYSSAISITSTTTLKAISCYADGNNGSSSSATYTLTCSTSSVANGSVSAYPSCTITCNSGYTLSGSTCVASGGGGGGSSSGGSYSYTPIAITPATTTPATTTTTTTSTIPGLNLPYSNPTTTTQIQANRTALISYIITLIQQINNKTTLSGIPSGFQFNNNLALGSTGNDVKYLQILLNSDESTTVGNSGNETTYFGNMTRSAVGKFQIKHGLVSGISDAGYGMFGPKTRAKANSLL